VNDALSALAAEAYVYGFPLVFNLDEIERVTKAGLGAMPAARPNEFAHATQLAGPDEKFVSINNDTVYSVAVVDLGGGPLRLDVPDRAGRYYVLQFVDAWTNNFAYVGHRATGTEEGSFLLVPPGWEGAVPAGARPIHFPTRIGVIVGRWAVRGEADMPAVRELQSGLTLTAEGGPAGGLPVPAEGVPEDLAWFERLRTYLDAYPPAERDRRYQERFRPLGVLDEGSPFVSSPPEVAEALRAGLAAGRERVERGLHDADAPFAEPLEPELPRLRLQPRLLRAGGAGRRSLEAARRRGPIPDAGARGAGRPLGQPRLRGRLRDGLSRR
jgi:hypothetical protein